MSGSSSCEELDVWFGLRIHGPKPDFTPPLSVSGSGFMGSNRTDMFWRQNVDVRFGPQDLGLEPDMSMSGLSIHSSIVRFGHRIHGLEPDKLKPDMAMSGLSSCKERDVRFEPLPSFVTDIFG